MHVLPRKSTAVLATALGLALSVPTAAVAASTVAGGGTTLTAVQSTGTADRLLRVGSRGEDVRAWQQVLNRAIAAGLVHHGGVAVDGIFGSQTATVTIALQTHLGITPDGVVGPVTQDAVAGALESAGPRPAPTPGEQGEQRLLRVGSRGDDVRAWQRTLNRAVDAGKLHHTRVAEDGIFGSQTRTATLQVQKQLDVVRDGVVGPVTRDGLAWILDH